LDGGSLPANRLESFAQGSGESRIEGDQSRAVFTVLSIATRSNRSEQNARGGKRIMIRQTTIYVTKTDRERLSNMIELARDQHDRANLHYVGKLEKELKYADVVAPEEIPPDVVTMRSRIKLKDLDTDEEKVYSIVFPSEANFDEGKISILAPLATALLGYKQGDTVEFEAPARLRRLQVLEILYQPESSGDYDL
jgi:regulator of nucleoside diphosphate kinase